MPKATCRCGAALEIPDDGSDRIVCPQCAAKIRIRRDGPKAEVGDGFIRFNCPCGRRLKVRESIPGQQSGKCPDCGRVVPVPALTPFANLKRHSPNETPTDEMDPKDKLALETWSASVVERRNAPASPISEPERRSPAKTEKVSSPAKMEAGLRVCPRCGKPLHLSAVTCRECGAAAPKR